MATVEFADLVRSIGVEPTNIVISRNPLCVSDEIKIEGYLSGVCSVNKQPPTQAIGDFLKSYFSPPKPQFSVKKILKNGDYMTVLWADGTKTIVKRAADEAESDYAAFTAALGIKCFGSNSALKRIVASAEEQGKKKKKRKEEVKPNKVEQAFDNAGKAFCKSAVALIEKMAKLREDEYEQQKTDEWLDGIEKKQNDNRS